MGRIMNQSTIEFTPKRLGHIHAARLETSERLQRVLALLEQGGRYTTREIVMMAHVMAASTAVAELRANGIDVQCRCIGRGRFEYWLE